MDALDTKICLAEALAELSAAKPYGKVSVSDIITAAGKNRATFYYHFEDKSHLTAWLFRSDLAALLEAEFEPAELVFEDASGDPCSALPYYARVRKGSRSLDGGRFMALLAQLLENRREFYTQVMAVQGPGSLDRYLYQLYLPAVEEDVCLMLSGRKIPASGAGFLAEFYTDALLSFFKRRLEMSKNRPLLEGAEPFLDILHSSIEHQIEAQQLPGGLSLVQGADNTRSFDSGRRGRTSALAVAQ